MISGPKSYRDFRETGPRPPGPLPWIRQCYSRSLYLTLTKLSSRRIMPLHLRLTHSGNCLANVFANPYPTVETVYILQGPYVPIKSRLRTVSLLASFARKSVKECDMFMREASELCGHQCGRPNTRGGTLLFGLDGDVRPARVCFSGFLS